MTLPVGRTRFICLLVVTSIIGGSLPVQAQNTAQNTSRIRKFYLPDGLEAQVWAQSPMFFNPTNIDIDHRGRMWVVEAVDYRGFNNRAKAKRWHDKGDRVVILEDTTGDGRADKSTVFVQDRDLVAPVGIAVFDNRVLVSCSPSLLLYTDVNRDGRFDPAVDKKEKFLTGFGGFDHDHGLHAVVSGPDGNWYLATGNAGPHIVTDRSGWTLRAGSLYTGGSPYNKKNQAGLKSDDGRVWVGGVALRFTPDGTAMTVIGHNFRNCYEICVDSLGNVYQSDNDDTISCRTSWLMEYGNTGFASADGERTWRADQRPGQSIPSAHWRQEDPGVIPSGDVYGPGAPTGIAFYENGSLGKQYRGLLLSCEAGRNVVWGYFPRAEKAGIKLKRFSFFSSVEKDDPNYSWSQTGTDVRKWFRPSDVCVGADGAVYVADWFDPIVGGHAMNDSRGSGMIYRIVAKGTNPRTPAVDLTTTAGQLAALASPANNVRYLGFSRLLARGEQVLPEVERLIAHENSFIVARAIYLTAQLGVAGRRRVEQLLTDKNDQTRLVAFRALRRAGVDMVRIAGRLSRDRSPAIRRDIALAMRDIPLERSRDILLAIAESYDGGDRSYLEALGTGCEGKEEAICKALLANVDADPIKWSDPLAAVVWRLHPTSAVGALRQRALSEKLTAGARKQAIDAIAFVADRPAAEAMRQIATGGPSDQRGYALWWIQNRENNLWHGFREKSLPQGERRIARVSGIALPPEPVFQSETIMPGHTANIDVDISGAKHLYLVVTDAGDGNRCDWADWADPRLVGPESEIDLTKLKWKQAFALWGQTLVGKNCKDLPLKIGGRTPSNGIGTHALSVIVYDISGKGMTRFRAHAGIDDGRADLGGASYPGGSPSVVFQVFHDGPTPAERAAHLVRQLQDAALSKEKRTDVARQLSLFKEGGLQLVSLASRGRLPKEFEPVIAEHIHHNPDLAVRAIAGKYFPRKTATGAVLPPIEQLARLPGDIGRGRALFLGKASCNKCHRVAGEGASVGPDLTEIRRKFGRPQLLDAIVNPSAAILFGYESWLITTAGGDVLTGTIVGAGDPLIVADPDGKQRAIARGEIDQRRRLSISIMPETSSLELNPQDLADLAEFLLSRPAKPAKPKSVVPNSDQFMPS